jgi:hypothetical protein
MTLSSLAHENLNSAKQTTMAAVYAMKLKRLLQWGMMYQAIINRCPCQKVMLIAGYAEIDAWSRLTNIELTPLEVSAIMRLDSAYLNIQAEQIAKRSKTK